MFYQDGDSPVSLALKRTLEEARFAWVLDFLNLLTVCYNKFVPVVSTTSVSLCVVALIFFNFSSSFALISFIGTKFLVHFALI